MLINTIEYAVLIDQTEPIEYHFLDNIINLGNCVVILASFSTRLSHFSVSFVETKYLDMRLLRCSINNH